MAKELVYLILPALLLTHLATSNLQDQHYPGPCSRPGQCAEIIEHTKGNTTTQFVIHELSPNRHEESTKHKLQELLKPAGAKRDNPQQQHPPSAVQDFTYLRIKSNQDKVRDFMAADAMNPVYEPNFNRSREPQYGGVIKTGRNRDRSDAVRALSEMNYGGRVLSVYDSEIGCNFETECKWAWNTNVTNGFVRRQASANGQSELIGPKVDGSDNKKGHYLMLRLQPTTKELHVTSPDFEPTEDTCSIRMSVYQEYMDKGLVRIVLHHINNTQIVVDQIRGDDPRTWIHHDKTIGKVSQNFRIILEVVPAPIYSKGSLIAFDNIKLHKCYPEPDRIGPCLIVGEYNCNTTGMCTRRDSVCDIVRDCPDWDDEQQNCDKVPYGARCTFDNDWCGWDNEDERTLNWRWHNGTTNYFGNTNTSGQFNMDHTYNNNSIGRYMHVMAATTKNSEFAAIATLKSVIFNPPPSVHGNLSSPYYNSCQIRFYFHQTGYIKSGLGLQVTEMQPKDNVTRTLWWSYETFKKLWVRQVVTLVNITYRYYLHFDVRRGIRYNSDIAIDDITLSPECFGLNIPDTELAGYNYWNPLYQYPYTSDPSDYFVNETYYEFTSCGASGRYGPYQQNCTESYLNTTLEVEVLKEPGLSGIQKWVVPSEGYYTFVAFGASGGKGSAGLGSARGAMTRAVLELKKSEEIYILVGQEGQSACLKSMDSNLNTSCNTNNKEKLQSDNKMSHILSMDIKDGGGGGGGATYVFFRNRKTGPVSVMVAAGGGGIGLGRFIDTGFQHGRGIVNITSKGSSAGDQNEKASGPGGSWHTDTEPINSLVPERSGQSFPSGSVGGTACYVSEDGRGDGGFGGGGGGCNAGGGGGGYMGGVPGAGNTTDMDGGGGTSFITPHRTLPEFTEAIGAFHTGSGLVTIIPAISGCGCDYRCLALDARRSQVICICPKNWRLDEDGLTCIVIEETSPDTIYPTWFVVSLIGCLILVVLALSSFCFMMYNRYQFQAAGVIRRKMLTGPDLQLNRLRVASDGMITEYNPNYEFGGHTYTLKDLKDIPRDQLRLIKALGQGAFGEVYQGFYRQRSGDTVEMPVAVKTLPEMSTHQAELDFLMEALIMSKFNHPNIVHFIGVCFDKHPRFIVLELLAGGDLKNFLRESRPKPEKVSPLSMKDLILISIDVAKGCKYLEGNRFIHRDIAARNCLLTTKGPGRCVKIADFGMSRDIYRSDYYRKGGKAMLPIKWMPPEAFLDGIFTSKTDVWSFGVLLWEIMSMGYMPYTGCANRDVMQLVTSGGRLEPPANCPGPVYGIMTQCWHPAPEKRPDFALILERLGYCSQDPHVMSAPLPVFFRPPSHERDATVMRPLSSDDNCLQVPQSADYLIPNHTIPSQPRSNTIGSTSSVDKLIPENSDSWETSFVIPSSKSTQPLLQQESKDTIESIEGTGSVDKLLTDDIDKTATSSPQNVVKTENAVNNCVNSATQPALKTLDAAALAKKYIPDVTSNGIIQKQYMANNAGNQFHNESEISC